MSDPTQITSFLIEAVERLNFASQSLLFISRESIIRKSIMDAISELSSTKHKNSPIRIWGCQKKHTTVRFVSGDGVFLCTIPSVQIEPTDLDSPDPPKKVDIDFAVKLASDGESVLKTDWRGYRGMQPMPDNDLEDIIWD